MLGTWEILSGLLLDLPLSRETFNTKDKRAQQEFHGTTPPQCIWWFCRHPHLYWKFQEQQSHSEEWVTCQCQFHQSSNEIACASVSVKTLLWSASKQYTDELVFSILAVHWCLRLFPHSGYCATTLRAQVSLADQQQQHLIDGSSLGMRDLDPTLHLLTQNVHFFFTRSPENLFAC